METARLYYRLTKPGIVKGNLIPAIAGFILAAEVRRFNLSAFLAMIAGLALVIAAACVFNNYIDRDIDKLMQRTKTRAVAAGKISGEAALTYGISLLVIGSLVLYFLTNLLTLALALFGWFAYVVLYGIGKRKTVHGTLIGSISGAMPPVVGYCALTNHLDLAALLLFLILVLWQMPHFYAIALWRQDDYKKAHIPVLPLVSGTQNTKLQIIIYAFLFGVGSAGLSIYGYTGYSYLAVMIILSLIWLWFGVRGFKTLDSIAWAKRMFFFSLLVLIVQSTMIILDRWLP